MNCQFKNKLNKWKYLPNVGRGNSPSGTSPERSSIEVSQSSTSLSLSSIREKHPSLVQSAITCLCLVSLRRFILQQLFMVIVRFGCCLLSNFFLLSQYSRHAGCPGESPRNTKYFFFRGFNPDIKEPLLRRCPQRTMGPVDVDWPRLEDIAVVVNKIVFILISWVLLSIEGLSLLDCSHNCRFFQANLEQIIFLLNIYLKLIFKNFYELLIFFLI